MVTLASNTPDVPILMREIEFSDKHTPEGDQKTLPWDTI